MDLFAEFATDTVAEEQGAWEEFGDIKFLIARAGNKSYNKLISRHYEKNKMLLDKKNEASEAKSDEIIVDVMARTILLGWQGDIRFKGEPLGAYSIDGAKKLLAVKDFRKWVNSKAEDFDRFKVKIEEEIVGESSAS